MIIVNLKKSTVVDLKNRLTYFMLLPESFNVKNFQIGYTTIYPNGDTHPPHTHENSEEAYFVRCGKGIMRINMEEEEIKEGDVVYIPAGSEHYTKNTVETTLEYLWIISPPSPLPQFLKEKLEKLKK